MKWRFLVNMVAGAVVVSFGLSTLWAHDVEDKFQAALYSEDPDVRLMAFEHYGARRADAIRQMMSVIESERASLEFEGSMHQAIDMLGRYRAAEAVRLLVKHIDFQPENMALDPYAPQQARYVAAFALAQIGEPAVAQMNSVILTEQSRERRELAAWVVLQVRGREGASDYFGRVAEACRDARQRQRFVDAKAYVTNFEEVLEPPGDPGTPMKQPGDETGTLPDK